MYTHIYTYVYMYTNDTTNNDDDDNNNNKVGETDRVIDKLNEIEGNMERDNEYARIHS